MENYIIRSKARRQLKDRMGLAVRTILLSTILLNIVNVMLDITDDNILPFLHIICHRIFIYFCTNTSRKMQVLVKYGSRKRRTKVIRFIFTVQYIFKSLCHGTNNIYYGSCDNANTNVNYIYYKRLFNWRCNECKIIS